MEFVDNINPSVVASRNAADITLVDVSASKVEISVSAQGADYITFAAEPYSGVLKIRLADILNSILQPSFPMPPQSTHEENAIKLVTIEASSDDEESPTFWSRLAFPAGYDESYHDLLMESYWWTWRDQICRTFVEGREYLGAIFEDGTSSVTVTATFSDGTSSSATLATLNLNVPSLAVIDVSYARIKSLFLGKTVKSYKVYKDDSDFCQVYEVSGLRPRAAFVFRNSLGLFDTVYAMGSIADGAIRDVKTFIGEDRDENISDNASRERIYVNSGHIDTKGERTLWTELVHSDDVWEYSDGVFRKIVIDAFEMKLKRSVSDSMTFEYHYSEAPKGGGYDKSEL